MLEMELNAQRNRNSDTILTKVGRELDVVLGGTVTGTVEYGNRAMTEPETLLKLGTSAVMATGLTLAQGKRGLVSLSAQVAGLAMAGAYATDVYGKGEETWKVMKDTWNSPENASKNREQIKNTLGPFVVDFGIYGAGGAIGIGAGKYGAGKLFGEPKLGISLAETTPGVRRMNAAVETGSLTGEKISTRAVLQAESRSAAGSRAAAEVTKPKLVEIPVVEGQSPSVKKLPVDSPLAKLYQKSKQEVGKIEVISVTGNDISARTANATSLGEGKLVTNFHVVDNATDIYIMDAAGRSHKAHTFAFDQTSDLAIVQLTNKESWAAFKAASVKNTTKVSSDEGVVVAIGHYQGSNTLHASPGIIPPEWRQSPLDFRFLGCIREGNCGGPVYNMNGEVLGIVKAGLDGRNGTSAYASPTWHFDRIMKYGTKVEPPPVLPTMQTTTREFKIENIQAAKENIARMFGSALEGPLPADFFHSTIKRVPIHMEGRAPRDLILRTQITPATREVVIEPIAYGGKSLTPETHWPGTEIPMLSSRLNLQFDSGLKGARMQSVNDPLGVLNLGFAFRSETSYLAGLKPTVKPGS
jgi:S1-C subfamily serine protease